MKKSSSSPAMMESKVGIKSIRKSRKKEEEKTRGKKIRIKLKQERKNMHKGNI